MRILLSGKSPLQMSHEMHNHDTWEIIANIEGNGHLQFEDRSILFDENTVVCIPPGVTHAKYSETGFRDLWIQASDFPDLDCKKPILFNDDAERSITSLINILYSAQYGNTPNRKSVVDSLWDSIQAMILSRIEYRETDSRVEEIANKILQSFQDPDFSVDDCLSLGGYCPDHMRRLFRHHFGKTPHEYLSELRIKAAKKLLTSRGTSNYSVSQISHMAGFHDVAYFSRIFKKATGVPPGKYFEKK